MAAPQPRILTLRPIQEQPQSFRLLTLPLEIRELIWRYTLCDIPLWQRRHRPACDYAIYDAHSHERPPFLESSRYCLCHRRPRPALLQSCRKVYQEAAPIFWSNNTHCFSTTETFVCRINTLREETRRLLRHISIAPYCIYHEYQRRYYSIDNQQHQTLWDAILLCTGLETLEIDPQWAKLRRFRHDLRQRVRLQLPNLKWIKLAIVLNYKVWIDQYITPKTLDDLKRRNKTTDLIYIRTTQNIAAATLLGTDPPDVNNQNQETRRFEKHFLLPAQYAIHTVVAEQPDYTFDFDRQDTWPTIDAERVVLKDLIRSHSTRDFTLRNGITAVLEVLDAPLGAVWRKERAQRVLNVERECRGLGTQTPYQKQQQLEATRRRRIKIAAAEEERYNKLSEERRLAKERSQQYREELRIAEADCKRQELLASHNEVQAAKRASRKRILN